MNTLAIYYFEHLLVLAHGLDWQQICCYGINCEKAGKADKGGGCKNIFDFDKDRPSLYPFLYWKNHNMSVTHVGLGFLKHF